MSIRIFARTSILSAIALAGAGAASADVFLKVDGAPGEATLRGFEGQIAVGGASMNISSFSMPDPEGLTDQVRFVVLRDGVFAERRRGIVVGVDDADRVVVLYQVEQPELRTGGLVRFVGGTAILFHLPGIAQVALLDQLTFGIALVGLKGRHGLGVIEAAEDKIDLGFGLIGDGLHIVH